MRPRLRIGWSASRASRGHSQVSAREYRIMASASVSCRLSELNFARSVSSSMATTVAGSVAVPSSRGKTNRSGSPTPAWMGPWILASTPPLDRLQVMPWAM